MPIIRRLLEGTLSVEEPERAARFDPAVLGLEPPDGATSEAGDRVLRPLQFPGGQVVLPFQKGSSTSTAVLPGGTIPPHDGRRQLHLNFADLEGWRERLRSLGVAIEGGISWPRDGMSFSLRGLDGHLVELVTPGLWPVYRGRKGEADRRRWA